AVRRPLGGGTVVSEDVVDQRVVENLQVLQRIEQPADVVVGMFQKPGVDLHLAREYRLERRRHGVVGGNFFGSLREDRVGGNHAQLLLTRNVLLAQLVPSAVEL